MTVESVPDGWTEIDTEFEQQIAAYQRRRDGLVLSLESGVTSDKYDVAALPENFANDNQAIPMYGDSGYIYSGDSLEDAESDLTEWMENNPK